MDGQTISLLRRAYREFYFKRHELVEIPYKIAEREFGYMPFGGGMIRHLTFSNAGGLLAELVKQAPSSVYCSNARYSDPSLSMDEKGWEGAELIFDIDADTIPTPCKAKHDWWRCQSCRGGGRGLKPAICTNCKGQSTLQMHWVCSYCLSASKEHVYRLMDFLVQDFGVRQRNIRIYFSGNRGYHLHVPDERFEMADSQERAEMANYMRGVGLMMNRYKEQESSTGLSGWGFRAARFVGSMGTQNARRQSKTLEQLLSTHAALIDVSVTTDIHRVFRMPGTLHGGSGMLKMEVESLETFDPQSDPVVLGDENVKIRVDYSPEFYMRGRRYGPYNSTTVGIPLHAAVFLTAKDLGSVLQ